MWRFVTFSKIFFHPKIGQRYNSSANIRTILQEQLANKFQKIELKKPKLTVSDQTFIGLPDQKRKGLILNLLSENIREVIELETKCDYFEANKMLKRVQLKEEVIDDKFETPQSLLDDAAFYVEREQDFPAFKAAWKCINLQLDNFLLANEVVADEKQTVRFLQKYHTDKEFTYVWTLFEAQHRSIERASDDDYESYVCCNRYSLKEAENFCNVIHEIHERKSFNRNDFLNWLPEEDFLEAKILINEEWKRMGDLLKEGKITIERPYDWKNGRKLRFTK